MDIHICQRLGVFIEQISGVLLFRHQAIMLKYSKLKINETVQQRSATESAALPVPSDYP